nr:S8 family serine peptidase [uncultured Desulfuromonas sp.]
MMLKKLMRKLLCSLVVMTLLGATPVVAQTVIGGASNKAAFTDQGESRYIVQLEGQPVALYQGDIPGYAATNPRAAGTDKLDLASPAAQAYSDYLRQQRQLFLSQAETLLGTPLAVVHDYTVTFNGVSVNLTAAQARLLSKVPGVIRIQQEQITKPRQHQASSATSQSVIRHAPLNNRQRMTAITLVLVVFALCWGVAEALRRRRAATLMWWGIAVVLTSLMAACGSGGDKIVNIEWPYEHDCSPGVAWINAPAVWYGALFSPPFGTMGEGVVVGIIDTGINPYNPSFAEVGGDGYEHVNPKGKFYGVCDPDNPDYDPDFPCNNKLIGAWVLADDREINVDTDGHGSHVAATAAGNIVYDAAVTLDSGYYLSATISGVAPHANIISYNTEKADGSLSSDAILAAIEQAVVDEVDVINMSLGGGKANPWTDTEIGLPLFAAHEAGIYVAVAAGNDGPGEATVDNPGIIPWLTAVAATTHDISYVNTLEFVDDDATKESIAGLALSLGYESADIVYAGDYGDATCTGSFNALFDGQIVICDRGDNDRTEKAVNVAANGGGAMILAEVDPGDKAALMTDACVIPSVHIAYDDAEQLKVWLNEAVAAGKPLRGLLTGTEAVSDPLDGDIVTGFSSRGENSVVPEIIKPDIAAPGANIFAPVAEAEGYAVYNGTSMASPHVAGVLALVKGLHPEWSPAQAQSAIMSTAWTDVTTDYVGTAATPFDGGAGRINAPLAMRCALLLDEQTDAFRLADPANSSWAEGGLDSVPLTLNLAAFGDGNCIGQSQWTRELTNVGEVTTRWSVSVIDTENLSLSVVPDSFELAAGESIELQVTADATTAPLNEWLFGRVVLTEEAGRVPTEHFPLAVYPQAFSVPETLEAVSDQISSSASWYNLQTSGATQITSYGLVAAQQTQELVSSDPTPADYTNDDGGVVWLTVDVAEGTLALYVDADSQDSPDIDLFVGQQGSDEEIGVSATGGADESVTVMNPEPGQWWIAVQNFASGSVDDLVTIRYGVVNETDAGLASLTVTPQNPSASPFVLTTQWAVPTLESREYWYGVVGVDVNTVEGLQEKLIPLRVVGE